MKALPIYDPFTELDRLFEGFVPSRDRLQTLESNLVPLDVYSKDGFWFLKASMPGVKPEDLEITVEQGLLTVRGRLNFDEEHKDAKVYRREIASGSFVRSVRLPENIDATKAQATFENGFVTVKVPKSAEDKPAAFKVPLKTIGVSSK